MQFKLPEEDKLIRIPDLSIIRKIGEGGMSVVYLAKQNSLKRQVAVKVMRMEVANNQLDVGRFKHEAETIAQLDHPNIIHIYSIGQTEKGEAYFTMPYLNHGDFSGYIMEDEQSFIDMLKSICDGLAYAHDRGVVHRDIKPENLLFDKFGNVNIADFGIAISKNGDRMTKEHQVMGSARYMSPEQVRSSEVDVRTDIYSLGIVIYERLTGQVPFHSDENISILVGHVTQAPPKLSSKFKHWQKLIDKCLAKSPKDRFQSMAELKEELDKMSVKIIKKTNTSLKSLWSDDENRAIKWLSVGFFTLLFLVAFLLYRYVYNPVTSDDVNGVVNVTETNTEFGSREKDFTPEEFPYDDLLSQSQWIDKAFITKINGLFNRASASNTLNKELLKADQGYTTIDFFMLILAEQPNNVHAQQGLQLIHQKYFELMEDSINDLQYHETLKHARSFMLFEHKAHDFYEPAADHKKAVLALINDIDLSNELMTVDKMKSMLEIFILFDPANPMIDTLKQQLAFKLQLH